MFSNIPTQKTIFFQSKGIYKEIFVVQIQQFKINILNLLAILYKCKG